MRVVRLSDLESKELAPGYHARVVHSKNMTLVYWDIEAGYPLSEHAHPHEQVLTLLKGEFELTVAGESQTMGAGSVAIIPSNAPHKGMGITDCRIVDVFYPIREDYRLQ
jgi:quercetin dioxygenase-like cupin family protein